MDFMLAERGTLDDLDRLRADGYTFDLKVDGIRAMVSTGPDGAGRVAMATRAGTDLTRRFPELVQALAPVARRWPAAVFDAEIAVPDAQGLPSWPLTQQRTAQRSGAVHWAETLPAHLYVFDLLRVGSDDTAVRPYRLRRSRLEELAGDWGPPLGLTVTSDDPWPLWEVVTGHRLEGVVAKRQRSRYHPGRSGDWVKIKAVKTVSCLVGGVDWGPDGQPPGGRRDPPRALELYLVDPTGALEPIGRVGAASSGQMRRQLLAGLRSPPLIVEVEFSAVTRAGRLRQPVLRRVRTDLDVLACGTDQLTRPG